MAKISVDEFVTKYENKSVDFDKKYGAQCVDLFNFYNSEVVGAPFIGTPVTGGARDIFETDSQVRSENYKKLAADSQLQVGDVLVFGAPHGRYISGGSVQYFGHVNIYVGNDKILQQNGKVSGFTTIEPVFKTGLLGILRPLRFIGQTSPSDVPQQSKTKNKHKIESGDTFWGLENTKGLEHGTLQKLNPELDAKCLKIGSEIITEPEPAPAPSAAETYYELIKGDNFWNLEDAWAIPHGTLTTLNPELEPRELAIGQRIRRS